MVWSSFFTKYTNKCAVVAFFKKNVLVIDCLLSMLQSWIKSVKGHQCCVQYECGVSCKLHHQKCTRHLIFSPKYSFVKMPCRWQSVSPLCRNSILTSSSIVFPFIMYRWKNPLHKFLLQLDQQWPMYTQCCRDQLFLQETFLKLIVNIKIPCCSDKNFRRSHICAAIVQVLTHIFSLTALTYFFP